MKYYCECCFGSANPVSINTTHKCDPKIKRKRDEEREEYHKTVDDESAEYAREAYKSAEETGDDVWWVDKDIMLKGVPNNE